MKKLTAATLAALMLLSAAGCGKDDADTDITTETTETTATTATDTTATTETTTETTVMTTVETEETTVTTEAPVDLDALLEGYTVYDVTVEECKFPIKKLDVLEKPQQVALRFTDLEEFVVIMELKSETVYGYEYSLKRAITGRISIAFEPGFVCRDGYFFIEKLGDTVIIKNNTLWAKLSKQEYHIFTNDEYYHIKNFFNEDGYVLELSVGEHQVRYSKMNEKYYLVNNAGAFLEAYETDDDFYSEYGTLSFGKDEIIYNIEEIITIGDSGFDTNMMFTSLFEKHGVSSIAELKAVYEQYKTNGKLIEFDQIE